jgi:hypothetical protein
LSAGVQYTVTFDAELQGYSGSTPITTFDVSLGNQTQTETANGDGASYILTFTPTADEMDAELAFTSVLAPDTIHEAVLSDIVLNAGPSVATAPEPASFALLGGGLLVALGWVRRRKV